MRIGPEPIRELVVILRSIGMSCIPGQRTVNNTPGGLLRIVDVHVPDVQPLRHNLAVLHTCKIVGLASADLQLRFTLAKQLSTYDFQNELRTLCCVCCGFNLKENETFSDASKIRLIKSMKLLSNTT